ncbi:MAG TPA: endonuclease/exonuclease/phosphatase family protein [Acidimicrobiales bacterium]|nr:endonuclease/exonuclease/phosphatase family protein [Acidimicrobiales bacterium]
MGDAGRLRVGTLNCRNTANDWRRRRAVLLSQLVELDPDVMGFQELRRWPSQAGWITRAVNQAYGDPAAYQAHRTYKTGLYRFWEGLAVLTRLPIVERGWLDLQSDSRVATFVALRLPDGGVLDFYNVHLTFGAAEERTAQARLLMRWLAERAGEPQVVVGDFNARPTEPAVAVVTERLRSAYAVVHDREPEKTVPTPLRGRAQGPDAVIDYMFVNDRVDVHDASVTFQRATPDDPRLVASDHYGLMATVSVRA